MELKPLHLYILFVPEMLAPLHLIHWIKDVTFNDKNIAFMLPFLSSLQLRWLKKGEEKELLS